MGLLFETGISCQKEEQRMLRMLAQDSGVAVGMTTTPNDKNVSTINNTTKCATLSRGKPRITLQQQIAQLLAYLKNPSLQKAEYEQAVRLLESTWRKYVAIVSGGVSV